MALCSAIAIDSTLCSRCGLCLAVCPYGVFVPGEDGLPRHDGRDCFLCDHCRAVCPAGAISIEGHGSCLGLYTVAEKARGPLPGPSLAADTVALMRQRRSCRNYRPEPVPLAILEDLTRIGTTAPSGTNCQGWSFTILPERADLLLFGGLCAEFFRRLNSLAASPPLRLWSRLFYGDALGRYHRNHRQSVVEALDHWDRDGRDLLFHGAAAAILVAARRDSSCPGEDAMLATANILLAAEAMGLGSCLIGFATEAIRHSPRIRASLQLPSEEDVHAVIALGYPAVRFARSAARRPVQPRVLRLAGEERPG